MPYPFTTALRLEVEDTTAVTNLVQNRLPIGPVPLGAWGYVTPLPSSLIEVVTGNAYLRYRTTVTQASHFTTEAFPITAGTKVAGALYSEQTLNSSANEAGRVRLQFLNDDGALVSETAQGALTPWGNAYTPAAVTAPVGATFVRMRVDVYTAGANMVAGRYWSFGSVAIRVGSSVPDTGYPGLGSAATWVNLLSSSTSITVEREALNVGTLSAAIPDATYDPALNTLLRPGRRVRLTSVVGGATTTIFTGKIATASVTYDPLRTGPKRAKIALTAVDAVADLTQVSRPEGVATVPGLRAVLEGAGVPWSINGDSSQIAPQPVVATNESASALDQVAIVRDSVRGYAWVSREGVLVANDPGAMPSTTTATFTETSYGEDLDVSFDADRCINVVTIKHLRVNAATGQTVEVPYGPYARRASVDVWGPRAADFTVQGLVDTEATMKAYAEAVFDANATPQVRINAVTVRVDGTADLATKAHRDLYDKVRITNTAAGLDQTARVTALTHRITPRSWLVEMTFGKDGGVAAPQVTPALVSTPTTPDPVPTAWAPLTLAAPFTAGSPTPAYRMDAAGNVHLRGVVTVNTGTNGALVFTLPTGFRPTDQWSVPVRTNASNVVQRLIVLASGNATINWAGTAPTTFGLETVFSTL